MRIRPNTFHLAKQRHPLLPLLLPAVRGSIEDATRELGWITAEMSLSSASSAFLKRNGKKISLYQACWLRGQRFMPLQYILGSQPFGPLDIKCVPRVLIPRWETEEWSFRLARLIQGYRDDLVAHQQKQLVVTDLCTGTGCILLLLACYLGEAMKGYGVDIEPRALRLVQENIQRNHKVLTRSRFRPLPDIDTICMDILNPLVAPESNTTNSTPNNPGDLQPKSQNNTNTNTAGGAPSKTAIPSHNIPQADLITANPPYISQAGFRTQTERSVKLHEPHKALLGGQEFYRAILDYAHLAKAKAVVCEVGDLSQIEFCLQMATDRNWSSIGFYDSAGSPRGVAIWRDPSWDFLSLMAD